MIIHQIFMHEVHSLFMYGIFIKRVRAAANSTTVKSSLRAISSREDLTACLTPFAIEK